MSPVSRSIMAMVSMHAEAHQDAAVRHLGERVEVGPTVARMERADGVAFRVEMLEGQPLPDHGAVPVDLLDRLAVHLAAQLGARLAAADPRRDLARHRPPLGDQQVAVAELRETVAEMGVPVLPDRFAVPVQLDELAPVAGELGDRGGQDAPGEQQVSVGQELAVIPRQIVRPPALDDGAPHVDEPHVAAVHGREQRVAGPGARRFVVCHAVHHSKSGAHESGSFVRFRPMG